MSANITTPLWVRVCLAALAVGSAVYLLRGQLPLMYLPLGQQDNANRRCETPVNDRVLSDEVVARLKDKPLRSKRAPVESLLGVPYCQLPMLHIRSEVESQRFLYKQAEDPPWLIVLYEGSEYTGYTLSAKPPQRGRK